MNPIAQELNQMIEKENPHIFQMLSEVGKNLFFPKGILSQGAEAKAKASRFNATIGIATEQGKTMHLPSIMDTIAGISPEASLTYAPSYGIPALRKSWQDELFEKNPSLANEKISLPVVTAGITHALAVSADIWVEPNDVIIAPDMMWGNYNMIFKVRRGAELSPYTLFSQNDGLNLVAFEEKIWEASTKLDKVIVLLNFPHNPTGYMLTPEEGNRIAKVLTDVADKGTNIIAVCDDAYFGLFYEEASLKESLFTRLCNQHPRLLAIKLDGATKENFVWGLRVGFVTYGSKIDGDSSIVYDALEKKTAGCVRGSISNVSHFSQSAVLKSMQDKRYAEEKEEKFEILKRRAKRVKTVLKDHRFKEVWDAYPFNSGYFMCLRLKTVDAEKLRQYLLETYGVGLISLGKRDLRIAFSCMDEDEILELFEIILKGVRELTARNQ
ncbi:MAG TPA: aminotransferase class I/II-fold pyridoxal phosphate-dependent enzyme [Desulfobacterales bacterium]|nr:aminotransferase class I/II-fold pyridoxal phosphate-dependent enzyme [Desulfobacterales bacterium]